MSCIEEFKNGCLNPRQKIQMDRAVAGAQHTFAFLCDDPGFQSGTPFSLLHLVSKWRVCDRLEYLQHQSCLRGTSDDWERCAYHFQVGLYMILLDIYMTVNYSCSFKKKKINKSRIWSPRKWRPSTSPEPTAIWASAGESFITNKHNRRL